MAESEPHYVRAIAMLEDQQRVNLRELGALMANLASIYSATGRTEAAESLYERALEVLTKAYGSKHEVVARVINELAETRQALGKKVDAEES
jgi:tetratricopeptide (TPR) repeat protein